MKTALKYIDRETQHDNNGYLVSKGYSLIVFFLICFFFNSNVTAQDSISKSNTVSLGQYLELLKQKFNIGFVYESKVIEGKTIHYHLPENETFEEILDASLREVNLRYVKISEDTYVIKSVTKNLTLKTLSGRVVSESDGVALPGVSIITRDYNIGTITNHNGEFKIQLIPSENDVLIFRCIGYKTKEVLLGEEDLLEIELFDDQRRLSEVVVTASGLNMNKKKLGYSIQNIPTEEVIKAREGNIVASFSAKATGVQVVSSSGAPGASASIRIRGQKSINSSNSPLFIMDGMLISNTTSGNSASGVDASNRAIDINPNDIETITILKGPAATVLYGTRAGNGAVMITTKRGTVNKPSVVFTSDFGLSDVNKLPPKQTLYSQGRPQNGILVYRGPETGEGNSYGPPITDLEFDGDMQYAYDINGKLVPKGQGNGLAAIAYDDYGSFWIRGKRLDQNLSIRGGSKMIKYYFSLGNLYQTGVVPGADFRRTTVRSNLDFKLTEKTQIQLSTNLINSAGNRTRRGSTISGVTAGLFRNTPTFDIGNGRIGKDAFNNLSTYQFSDNTQRAYRGNAIYDNPFWVAAKIPYEDNVVRLINSLNLSYRLNDWLDLYAKFGYDAYTDSRDFGWDINSASEPLGRVDQSTRVSQRINTDLYFLIHRTLSKKLVLSGTIGHNYYSQRFELESTTGRKLSAPDFFDISNATDITSDRSLSRSKLAGLYFDIKLGFQNYLFLSVSGRNDWSSRLPKGNNSFFYSAASLSFEAIKAFNINSTLIDGAKFRISYGEVGNEPNIYQTQNSFSNAIIDGDNLLTANEFPAYGVNAFERRGRRGNPYLKPELTSTIEFGGDFYFFNNNMEIDFTYYRAQTKNALVVATLPAPSGFTSISENTGKIENKGFEVSLSASPVRTNHFKWEFSLNYTRNRSMVKTLGSGIQSVTLSEFSNLSSQNIVGQPYGVFSGTKYRRNDEGLLIIGSDGFPLIDTQQGIIGNPNPDWVAGIRNNIELGQFEFSMLWDVRLGGDVWNGTKAVMSYLGVSKESGDLRNTTNYVFDGVLENGERNTIKVDFANPAFGLSNILWRRGGFLGVAEDNIEDGSWVRLREIDLSFSFPRRWIERWKGLSAINFSIYGRNLLLFTEYSGIDPETNLRGPSRDQGWDYFNLPNTRSIGLALRVQFN